MIDPRQKRMWVAFGAYTFAVIILTSILACWYCDTHPRPSAAVKRAEAQALANLLCAWAQESVPK